MLDFAKQHKTIDGFPGGEPLDNDQLFALDVEVLVPAALENQITMDNAPAIRREDRRRRGQRSDDARGAQASCTSAAFSSSPTSSPMPAASRRRTSSGCRIVTATSGRRTRSTSASKQDVRGVRRCAEDVAAVQDRHAHRRLHRRHQPRRDGDEDARHVRVNLPPDSNAMSSCAVLSPRCERSTQSDIRRPRARDRPSSSSAGRPGACCTGTSAIEWPARFSSRAVTGGVTPPGAYASTRT